MQAKFTYPERIAPLVSKKPIPAACVCLLWAVALVAVPGQADTLAVTWDQRIEVASGQAYWGPWRMNESEFHYVDDPTVATNEQGVVGAPGSISPARISSFRSTSPMAQNGLRSRSTFPGVRKSSPGFRGW